jgi:anti-anti-sigma regulatory factor
MNVYQLDGVKIIKSPKRLDAMSAPQLRQTVNYMASSGLRLILDMEDVALYSISYT